MGKKTFASVQVKNKNTGQWDTESRELSTDDLVMYALLQDLLHGVQLQAVNLFLGQSSTDDRRAFVGNLTANLKTIYKKAAAPISSTAVAGATDEDDHDDDQLSVKDECFPPFTLCFDGTCRLVCPPPPNGDK